MWRSLRRLEQDLQRWQAAGWVTRDGGEAIRAELMQSRSRLGLANVLATFGAVLIGFAAMSFVAANWQEMSKLARLALLFVGLWGAYGTAGMLAARGLGGMADAAVLVGIGLFGASIMLIAQMYHMDGNPPDAVLTWACGALLAGVVLQSRPALAAAMLLVAVWSGWETGLGGAVHWAFLIGWVAVAAAILWQQWSAGLHLAALVLAGWTIGLGYLLNRGHAHELVLAVGLAAAAASLAAERLSGLRSGVALAAIGYSVATATAALLALQFFETPRLALLIALAVITIALLLALLVWGWRNGHRGLLWLAYGALSIEILALYFNTVGSLMGSSLFFLTAGLVVIALAWAAWRLHQVPQPREITA